MQGPFKTMSYVDYVICGETRMGYRDGGEDDQKQRPGLLDVFKEYMRRHPFHEVRPL